LFEDRHHLKHGGHLFPIRYGLPEAGFKFDGHASEGLALHEGNPVPKGHTFWMIRFHRMILLFPLEINMARRFTTIAKMLFKTA
jgi:hypothetical protein